MTNLVFRVSLIFSCLGLLAPSCREERSPGAKNIILMIADGCGFNHIEAAGFYQHGADASQIYEQFPAKYAVRTNYHDSQYDPSLAWSDFNYLQQDGRTDSAAAATAMSTGVKTYNGAIGVGVDRQPLRHLMDQAEDLGKGTGVVTTVQISHATPAGFVAHNAARGNYAEIAIEMIYESRLDVIMGAGHPMYTPDNQPGFTKGPDSYDYKFVGGEETWQDLSDGLATGADADGDGTQDAWRIIQTRAEFKDLAENPNPPRRVLGLAQTVSTLQQERSGDGHADPFVVPLNPNVPNLEEMAEGALNVLSRDPDGFVLMIEGGAVDWASHDNQSGRTIEELIDFNRAVEAVAAWIESRSSWRETLLIVTADHETGYLTGPGSGPSVTGPLWNPLVNRGARKVPGMQWNNISHTSSLVPLYAKGIGARFFTRRAIYTDPVWGRYLDNTDIAKVVFSLLGVRTK